MILIFYLLSLYFDIRESNHFFMRRHGRRRILRIFSIFISHNVLGIRRSSPPYKALRSNAVGWNVGERKHHKGRKPDWCFSNPKPPNRRRSVYRLLCVVWAFSTFLILIFIDE